MQGFFLFLNPANNVNQMGHSVSDPPLSHSNFVFNN